MRVIAGTARSMPLETVKGLAARPTTDRIKETLFNILQPYIPNGRFLDLYSGSGAIAIEALSRGAKEAVLVESARPQLGVIKKNLEFTRLSDRAIVLGSDVMSALSYLEGGEPFDVIFMDPPYDKLMEKQVLFFLKESSLIAEDGLVVVEASSDTDLSYLPETGFEIFKERNYGKTVHLFLKRKDKKDKGGSDN